MTTTPAQHCARCGTLREPPDAPACPNCHLSYGGMDLNREARIIPIAIVAVIVLVAIIALLQGRSPLP